jgi:phosphatidylserine decarboxylase
MKTFFFILCQYIIPQTLLSRFAGVIANCENNWFKNSLISWFIKKYDVDMSIAAASDYKSYSSFNDFFTRALAEGQRPIDSENNVIVCPADGCVSQIGNIQNGRIFQAKGQEFSLLELIGGDNELAEKFESGSFATIYLSPKDYHRVHIPFSGKLESMTHIPGKLFSVNETTANHVPRLFARNERVVCIFETEIGPMAVILVGAMIVASIETTWAGLVTPIKNQIRHWQYNKDEDKQFNKGDELGRFKLGSTAIILFAENAIQWEDQLHAQSPVTIGSRIATTK